MKRQLLSFILFTLLSLSAFATHQRAGEITFRYVSGLTYEITIVSYSYAPSPADRNELEILWGDGTSSVLVRNNGESGYNPAGLWCDHLGEMVAPISKRTCIPDSILSRGRQHIISPSKTRTGITGS
jgi:hypothetical protein